MSKRTSEITGSLGHERRLRVTDRGFLELLNTDLKELEIGQSLRRLGNTKVMEWDFKAALPTVHKIAHQEVDVVGWVKRIAHYKVMDWDFRGAVPHPEDEEATPEAGAEPVMEVPGAEELQELVERLRNFVQFVAVNLIDEPERAQIRVQEITPGTVRFRLVVTQADQKNLVGRDGSTAAAIRNLLKGTAAEAGVNVLLQILSHEEELTLSVRESEAK